MPVMARLVLCVGLALSTACAPTYQSARPSATNLTGYAATYQLAEQDGSCFQVTIFKNGRTVRTALSRRICEDAARWLAMEAQLKAQPPSPPKPEKEPGR